MDKQFLIENNLLEAHKQFLRLCEWDFNNRVPSSYGHLGEDDDPNAQEEDPNAMDGGMGQDPNAQGGEPPMGDPNAMDGGMGQDPSAMGGEPPMGDPNAMGGDMPPMDDEMPEDDDVVIDVDDITDAQEKMNAKINTVGKDVEGFDDKMQTLMNAIVSMEQMISQNNAEIAKFKQEFEKRNPTQDEKLNLRSLDSAPFNEKPKDWWEKENAKGRYNAYADNSEPTAAPRYIMNSDVDDFDERKIADSFAIDDDMIQSIEKIFGL